MAFKLIGRLLTKLDFNTGDRSVVEDTHEQQSGYQKSETHSNQEPSSHNTMRGNGPLTREPSDDPSNPMILGPRLKQGSAIKPSRIQSTFLRSWSWKIFRFQRTAGAGNNQWLRTRQQVRHEQVLAATSIPQRKSDTVEATQNEQMLAVTSIPQRKSDTVEATQNEQVPAETTTVQSPSDAVQKTQDTQMEDSIAGSNPPTCSCQGYKSDEALTTDPEMNPGASVNDNSQPETVELSFAKNHGLVRMAFANEDKYPHITIGSSAAIAAIRDSDAFEFGSTAKDSGIVRTMTGKIDSTTKYNLIKNSIAIELAGDKIDETETKWLNGIAGGCRTIGVVKLTLFSIDEGVFCTLAFDVLADKDFNCTHDALLVKDFKREVKKASLVHLHQTGLSDGARAAEASSSA